MKKYICEISLPEKIISFLELPKKQIGTILQRELAAHFFETNRLSFGQARQMADMSVWDFICFLKERKIPLHYGVLEYEDDSELVEKLSQS